MAAIRLRNKKRGRPFRFEVRLSAKERRALSKLAMLEGISDSAWVQRQIWKEMNELVAQKTRR